jgi:type VI protein secretion system component Hcp
MANPSPWIASSSNKAAKKRQRITIALSSRVQDCPNQPLEDATMRTSPLATWVAVCGSIFIASAARAASDYLLKIEGVDGESTTQSGGGQIEVSSYSWGVNQQSSVSPRDVSTGQASGKRQHKPLTVISREATTSTTVTERAAAPEATEEKTLSIVVPEPGNETTAQLVRLCATGKHIKKATLTGPDNARYELENVLVSSCAATGNQRKIELKGHVTLMK